MQRLCVHKSLVQLPAIAFFAKARPAYEELHGRPFRTIATMVQNLLDYEFLGVLLRHGNGMCVITTLSLTRSWIVLNAPAWGITW